MNAFNAPTIADLEDVARQILAAGNRLAPAIGIEAVQRRRREDVARMHEAVERVAADCVTDAERTQAAAGEVLAVGWAEDGTVAFYDLDAHAGVRRPVQAPPIGGGKSTHIVFIDELAAMQDTRVGELTRLLPSQVRKGCES
jgi:imidazole glycerol phosphate synthase subunit HisF